MYNSSWLNILIKNSVAMYITTANIIVNIIAIFCKIIQFSSLYMYIPLIPIIVLAIIGFIKNFIMLNLIFMFFIKATKLIDVDMMWHTTVAKAAPATPPSTKLFGFILTNIKFNINFTNTPIANAITGTLTFPSPCRAPFTVCSIVIKTMEILLI